jgi:uncharacterized membrane protein
MITSFPLTSFDWPDGLSLLFLLGCWWLTGFLIEHPPKSRLSVSHLMADYRRDWMREFVTRQPRIFDASVMDSLRQGTAFFASASMIAIGGGVALIGNSQQIQGLAKDLTLEVEGVAIEIKIILVIFLVANALLKFVWSHRLFGYCAIMMAAVPNDITHPAAYLRAAETAEVNISAAKGFNRGLRSIYFALAALGWLIGPWLLVVTTLATSFVLMRREFASHSRQAMITRYPDGPAKGPAAD